MKTTAVKKLISDLSSDKPNVKYPAAKKLSQIAKKYPQSLYNHLAFFVKLLKSENNIMKWNAIDIIGYLSCIDTDEHTDQMLKELSGFLRGEKLIAANHAVAAMSYIALAKPEYQERVTNELLGCESYKYETDECHNIVMGKVVLALASYLKPASLDNHVVEFLNRQASNTRPATRKKAEKILNLIQRKGRSLK